MKTRSARRTRSTSATTNSAVRSRRWTPAATSTRCWRSTCAPPSRRRSIRNASRRRLRACSVCAASPPTSASRRTTTSSTASCCGTARRWPSSPPFSTAAFASCRTVAVVSARASTWRPRTRRALATCAAHRRRASCSSPRRRSASSTRSWPTTGESPSRLPATTRCSLAACRSLIRRSTRRSSWTAKRSSCRKASRSLWQRTARRASATRSTSSTRSRRRACVTSSCSSGSGSWPECPLKRIEAD
mmetsp:Transcript_52441/g.128674  ORF Transcript_52441/g.128674 Transcript_52441/m.128674 type:complete len:246 (-) Transcript_52441:29-766(-)